MPLAADLCFSSLGSCAALVSQEPKEWFYRVYCSFVRYYEIMRVSKFQDFRVKMELTWDYLSPWIFSEEEKIQKG